MKTLIDNTKVTGRSYYYLLDWNEKDNWVTILLKFNKTKLCELNKEEYITLFHIATNDDLSKF